MSQELYTFTGVMCPQCKRLRNVTFKAKARTNGDLLLGLPSVDSRKILKEHLKKLCSICDGSYTAKDELACRIGTRLHSAADSLRPDAIKETYKSGWDHTMESINNGSANTLLMSGLTEAPHYQGNGGCKCWKCLLPAYRAAIKRCGLATEKQEQINNIQPTEYVLWSGYNPNRGQKRTKHQEE